MTLFSAQKQRKYSSCFVREKDIIGLRNAQQASLLSLRSVFQAAFPKNRHNKKTCFFAQAALFRRA
jgi:hypothetical protein